MRFAESGPMLPDPRVRQRYGVSSMTIWRWDNTPELGFPPPLRIAGRKYRRLAELEAWERKLANDQRGSRIGLLGQSERFGVETTLGGGNANCVTQVRRTAKSTDGRRSNISDAGDPAKDPLKGSHATRDDDEPAHP